jgi:hypothetical protein
MPKRRLAQAGEDVGKVRDQVTLMRRKSTQGGGDRGQEQVASMIEQEVRTVTPPPSFSTTAGEHIFINPDCIIVNQVPQSIKEKIWSNQYIELQNLLKKDLGQDSGFKQQIQVVNGELVISPAGNSSTSKLIDKIEVWTDAFLIFICIYVQKHPNQTINIMQYLANIRLAATKHIGWSAYDAKFRLKMSNDPNQKWETIDPCLWMLYVQPIQNFQLQSGHKRCFSFNNKGFCNERLCSYAHKCIKCLGDHPALYCPLYIQQNQRNNQNQFANLRPRQQIPQVRYPLTNGLNFRPNVRQPNHRYQGPRSMGFSQNTH